jgi:hypothetical protein
MVYKGIPMKAEVIRDHNVVLAILIRKANWENGLDFVSAPEDHIQVGTWQYKKGQKIRPHIHKIAPRNISKTQEVIIIRDGRVRADIYTENRKFLESLELEKEDVLILLNGGHGFEVLSEGTKVLEVKNGPYVGADKDRERI